MIEIITSDRWPKISKRAFMTGYVIFMICLLIIGAMAFLELRKFMKASDNCNYMKYIAIGLHEYHDEYDCFPPAVVYDEYGNPMHSWRALVEVQRMKSNAGDDYHQTNYQLDQPWNSPHNLEVARKRFKNSSSSGKGWYVDIFAVHGDRTAWKPGGHIRKQDITDGTSYTIQFIGIHTTRWNRYEPVDLTFDGNDFLLEGEAVDLKGRMYAGLADGRISSFGDYLPIETIRRLVTIDDGESIEE